MADGHLGITPLSMCLDNTDVRYLAMPVLPGCLSLIVQNAKPNCFIHFTLSHSISIHLEKQKERPESGLIRCKSIEISVCPFVGFCCCFFFWLLLKLWLSVSLRIWLQSACATCSDGLAWPGSGDGNDYGVATLAQNCLGSFGLLVP